MPNISKTRALSEKVTKSRQYIKTGGFLGWLILCILLSISSEYQEGVNIL